MIETIRRFRENLVFYARALLVIRDKHSRLHLMEFNSAQMLTHEKLSKQKRETGRIRAIILKARQEGISTYVAARYFRAIHLWPGTVAMIVADELSRAEMLFQIYDRYYMNLPDEIAPRRKSTQRGRYMAFSHDSELAVRPANDTEAGRAGTIHRLHASELAYWGNHARETWTSLMQAVPPGVGEVIIESTAKGAGGLFHELWEGAVNEENDWLPIFLPWWIHEEYGGPADPYVPSKEDIAFIVETMDPFEKQALYEGIPFEGEMHKLDFNKLVWRRRVIVENFGGTLKDKPPLDAVREFQREYPATAEEAFLVSGSCFFDEDKLHILSLRTAEPTFRGRLRENMEGEVITIELEHSPQGNLRIWVQPSETAHYVIGVDTAEGKLVGGMRRTGTDREQEGGDRDASAAIVIRLSGPEGPAKVVAELQGKIAPEVFTQQLNLLGRYYSCGGPKVGTYRNKSLVGVENNHSSGQTILRLLNEHYRYAPLFRLREMNKTTRRMGTRLGWRTDEVTRMPMLDAIAQMIREDTIEIPSKDMVREMVTFVVWENGKPMADEGCHDDRVMALGVALQMLREHRHSLAGPLPEYVPDEDSLTG